MVSSLIEKDYQNSGAFFARSTVLSQNPQINPDVFFSRVISVSFSAFDDFENIGEIRDKSTQISYHYVGQKSTFEENNNTNILDLAPEVMKVAFKVNRIKYSLLVSPYDKNIL